MVKRVVASSEMEDMWKMAISGETTKKWLSRSHQFMSFQRLGFAHSALGQFLARERFNEATSGPPKWRNDQKTPKPP
jgi:hypothetical protein